MTRYVCSITFCVFTHLYVQHCVLVIFYAIHDFNIIKPYFHMRFCQCGRLDAARSDQLPKMMKKPIICRVPLTLSEGSEPHPNIILKFICHVYSFWLRASQDDYF